MEVNFENAGREDAIYEGVLTSDDNGNYWITQGQKPVKLDPQGLNEAILEEREGEPVSVIGRLHLELRDNSSIMDYRLETKTLAELEGRNPENNAYVTRIGDVLIEAYENGVEEFEGETSELVTDIDNVAY